MRTRIGIVVSEFNNEITIPMLNEARQYAQKLAAKITYICFVPGVYDMPIIIEEILKKKNIDAVITLGAIIKGETAHDKVIADNTARLLGDLALKYNKPISLGITGPEMTYEQAESRIIPVSQHAVYTAISMANKIKKIRNNKMKSNGIKIID